MKSYRVGIIGCGDISDYHHQEFSQTGQAEIVKIYDIDPEQARKKAKQWRAEIADSAEELVGSVDIVVIATPGFARLEYIALAADAGAHILCEKPIALDLGQAHAIEAAVERSRGVFMVSLNQRYEPELATMYDLAAAGEIGGIVSAWARLHAPAPSQRWRDIEASGHWRSSFDLSGGRINEFSSHVVDWLLWVLGTPKSVYGRALHVTEGFTLDDANYAMIECETGTGLLDVCRHAGVPKSRGYGIMGHAGSVILIENDVWLTLMDRDPVRVALNSYPSKHQHFLDCIESGQTPKTDLRAGINTLRACLGFNKSVTSGKVEPII